MEKEERRIIGRRLCSRVLEMRFQLLHFVASRRGRHIDSILFLFAVSRRITEFKSQSAIRLSGKVFTFWSAPGKVTCEPTLSSIKHTNAGTSSMLKKGDDLHHLCAYNQLTLHWQSCTCLYDFHAGISRRYD